MNIEKSFRKTIKKYNLLNKRDKIAVALSGGKDSVVVFYLLKKMDYNIESIMIDLGIGEWSRLNKENMKKLCKELGVKLNIINFDFNKILKTSKEKKLNPCYICGIVKKNILNKQARKFRFDKIVTGHNLDDEVQTILMNYLKGNVCLGMNSTPATGISNKNFVQRVKPLFFIPESEIKKYARAKKFNIVYDKCPYAKESYRIFIRKWLNISDKEKLKIANNFQKIIPKLKLLKNSEVKLCDICGEPCSSNVCKMCQVFGKKLFRMR